MQVSITARKTIIQGLKLAAGTILAVALSKSLGILSPYATGTIALITLLSSKWETVRLTLYRLLTYFVTVAVSWVVYRLVPLPIVAFGLIMAVLYWLYNAWHLLSTLAVNGVICSHFMTYQDFSPDMILHEFLIVLIGVLSALLINQFYTKRTTERALRGWMAKSDQELVAILERIANHLDEEPAKAFHVTAYEESLTKAYALARDFEENTFSKHQLLCPVFQDAAGAVPYFEKHALGASPHANESQTVQSRDELHSLFVPVYFGNQRPFGAAERAGKAHAANEGRAAARDAAGV